MKKVLSVVYPSITSWTWHAALFSILEQYEYAKEWIFNNYIQIHCRPDIRENRLYLEFLPSYRVFLECPVIHIQYFDRKWIKSGRSTVQSFLMRCIDEGYYIYCVCNERYILQSDADRFHELFIYGYDENTAYVGDFTFTEMGRYSFEKASLDMVCKGIEDVGEAEDYLLRWEGGIILVRPQEPAENKYHIDKQYIRQQITEYLHGVNSLSHLGLLYNKDIFSVDEQGEKFKFHVWGIQVYQCLIEYLNIVKFVEDIDLRPFHNLYDHKKLMRMRIEYLLERKEIYVEKNIITSFKEIERKMEIICNMLLKALIKKNFSARSEIIRLLMDVRDKEWMVYNNLCEKL